ncbi:methylenetetrahydrofolate reductase-domain-containing protein [Mycotypha africana]|uniref:methylenetetrahydrofolate reductase-domain-containing protein n=1 Tax=Mycotypha africana TaxID=64632 RepID=UPI002300C2E5|nr:methylenetetrahydrofolate reductase-domain-containing protein [Mycotypha africana]KAI8982412.1 methylenetetrahydrofolate reductase-domain-containing protein [Mycotypha africana]
MKIIDKIEQAQKKNAIAYSFEYFPPKTELGFANLTDRLGRMAQLNPQFISCTWGTGGSTHDRTLELCSAAQHLYGLTTLMHLTCTNMGKTKIDDALQQAQKAGIRNILALRGDPPRGQEYDWNAEEQEFTHAIDLVKYIRQHYGDTFSIGVAGYPEGHLGQVSKDELEEQLELGYLKEKVEAGADFIMTQLFYDVDVFLKWIEKCREQGIQVPIVAGIMPIPTYHSFRRMVHLCQLKVPERIMKDLDAIKTDDQKVKEYGVRLAVSMIRRLHKEGNICNFHISTLNLERSTRLILEELQLHRHEQKDQASIAEKVAPWVPVHDPARAELWDEYPNGRYGDSRSPAFGEITYSASKALPTSRAPSKWGQPKTEEDITQLFVKYIKGEIDSLPWCEEKLHTESEAICQRLCDINQRGYWTVSSQPAVNGVPSQDAVYGWGPKNGYVYQKAFIEFFVAEDKVKELLQRLQQDECITYYAINLKGDFCTNVSEPDAQNALTWGVFPGKEIIQPTLIEKASFEAWKEEAFGLWSEWEAQYPRGSPSQKLLKDTKETYWLVNVVHNDYQKPNLLFDAILS